MHETCVRARYRTIYGGHDIVRSTNPRSISRYRVIDMITRRNLDWMRLARHHTDRYRICRSFPSYWTAWSCNSSWLTLMPAVCCLQIHRVSGVGTQLKPWSSEFFQIFWMPSTAMTLPFSYWTSPWRFDTVDNRILLERLWVTFGIDNSALVWFCFYLSVAASDLTLLMSFAVYHRVRSLGRYFSLSTPLTSNRSFQSMACGCVSTLTIAVMAPADHLLFPHCQPPTQRW